MKLKKEKELVHFKKYRSIYGLVEEVAEGKEPVCDEETKEIIFNSDYSLEFLEKLTSENKAVEITNFMESLQERKNKDKLLLSISKREIHKRKKLWMYRTLTGAVAAAVLVLSFYIWDGEVSQNKEVDVTKTISNNHIQKPSIIINNEVIALSEQETNVHISDLEFTQRADSTKTNQDTEHQVIVPSGYYYTVTLYDGTEVRLNASSELSYRKSSFQGSSREVTLQGEAFFNVTKSDKPFIVHFENGSIKVYGTSFNVKLLADGGVETVLVSGSVGIGYKELKEVMITPNQRIVFDGATTEYEVETVCADNYLGWLHNSFNYFNYNVREIITDIEKWYGIKIRDKHERIGKEVVMDMNISRESSCDKVITLLENALNVVIVNEGKGNYFIK